MPKVHILCFFFLVPIKKALGLSDNDGQSWEAFGWKQLPYPPLEIVWMCPLKVGFEF